ncbi:hypothetical protein RE628_11395 [Paenibacillus sp. D2_2]|uniref:hypothetical protein n=1 Tax=Paenibacillus sp. D2_2 TaxID=3073092 RepID=UPI0028167BF8|nr:hypothetical protein [Paenibacillus sp. D2_2]WMT42832.1 hypothetical protein RE628_11395 [Paenibacillus sp. D2_2]
MNDQQQLEYIKKEFGNNLKDGILNLHICWLIDQAEKLQAMKQGIPWIKYDPENPPEDCTSFIVTNGKNVTQASNQYDHINGLKWWDDDFGLLTTVTHYAPINLPGEG